MSTKLKPKSKIIIIITIIVVLVVSSVIWWNFFRSSTDNNAIPNNTTPVKLSDAELIDKVNALSGENKYADAK